MGLGGRVGFICVESMDGKVIINDSERQSVHKMDLVIYM